MDEQPVTVEKIRAYLRHVRGMSTVAARGLTMQGWAQKLIGDAKQKKKSTRWTAERLLFEQMEDYSPPTNLILRPSLSWLKGLRDQDLVAIAGGRATAETVRRYLSYLIRTGSGSIDFRVDDSEI